MSAASRISGCFIAKLERGKARRADADLLLFYSYHRERFSEGWVFLSRQNIRDTKRIVSHFQCSVASAGSRGRADVIPAVRRTASSPHAEALDPLDRFLHLCLLSLPRLSPPSLPLIPRPMEMVLVVHCLKGKRCHRRCSGGVTCPRR